jgi:hypothetical protein
MFNNLLSTLETLLTRVFLYNGFEFWRLKRDYKLTPCFPIKKSMFLVGKKQHFEVIPLFVNNSTLTAKIEFFVEHNCRLETFFLKSNSLKMSKKEK